MSGFARIWDLTSIPIFLFLIIIIIITIIIIIIIIIIIVIIPKPSAYLISVISFKVPLTVLFLNTVEPLLSGIVLSVHPVSCESPDILSPQTLYFTSCKCSPLFNGRGRPWLNPNGLFALSFIISFYWGTCIKRSSQHSSWVIGQYKFDCGRFQLFGKLERWLKEPFIPYLHLLSIKRVFKRRNVSSETLLFRLNLHSRSA